MKDNKGNLDLQSTDQTVVKKKVRRRIKKKVEKKSVFTGMKERSSKFREESANWMDGMETQNKQEESHSVMDKIRAFTPLQWAASFMAIVVFITSITSTVVYANYQSEQKVEAAFAELANYENFVASQVEATPVSPELMEMPELIEQETKQAELKHISLVLSSVEKDLKIKVVDQEDSLVTGVKWKVKVTDPKGKDQELTDDDADGVIYAEDMAAGDYSVALVSDPSLTEYQFPQTAMTVAVKAKIEYKVIQDIKDLIKKESQVNVAAEDTGGKQAADVETGSALKDTVEWVESTKTVNGSKEGYVEAPKTSVDLKRLGLSASAKKIKKLVASALDAVKLSAQTGLAPQTVLLYPTGVSAMSETTSGNGIESISISGTDTLSPGGTGSLTATVNPSDAESSVTWYSSDTQAIVIDNNMGKTISIRALDVTTEKSVTITASIVDKSANFTVRVVPVQTDVQVSSVSIGGNNKISLNGPGTTLTATVAPAEAKNYTIEWSNNGSSNVSIEGSGTSVTVKPISVGEAWITAKAGGKESSPFLISVTSETLFALSPTSTTINVQGKTQLVATGVPAGASVSFASNNTSIVSVAQDGTITGVSAGNAQVVAKCSNGAQATCDVKVTATANDGAQLYDKNGNELFVREGTSPNFTYRKATYADYKNTAITVFYIKGQVEEFLYTGWQTIEGLTYFFKKDHTKVTGEQIIGGVKYNFASDGSLTKGSGTLGIDVSKYQPSINWASVKASGISYVIIRCGYRGSSTGVLIEDPYFRSHVKGAKAAG
ncbi:MAG: hypothetical protein GX567_13275, partial [Clostridia bacterium]|nr:hypothetical protein [Clostridia bacterium]